MRIVVATLAGIAVALLTSFGIVRVVTTSQQDQVTQPLYNYGTR